MRCCALREERGED
ncbi:hypothetical protein A2U01_0100746, partial [Trifolium medium]|nr:hypothetical protein [Trifolium medium]